MGSNLFVYPNPARQKLTVESPPGNDATEVCLFTATGVRIRCEAPDPKRHPIDVSGLNPGIYVLKAGSANRILILH